MRVLELVLASTATEERAEMVRFLARCSVSTRFGSPVSKRALFEPLAG